MASDNAKIALNEKFELIKKDEEKTYRTNPPKIVRKGDVWDAK